MPSEETTVNLDIHTTRRRLAAMHRDFRNAGLNPVEAISELSRRIASWEGGALDYQSELLPASLSPGDLLALVYQEFLVSEARNGLGQYLTPLPVAEMIAQICSDVGRGRTVVDPFCGSGLLLDTLARRRQGLRLVGVEISEPVARLAEALAGLAGSGMTLVQDDAFAAWQAGRLPDADIVVANPPFGAVASCLDRNHPMIPQALRSMRQIPAELLGLEVCVSVLRPGGVVGIVVPQSVLTNSTWSAYRADVFRRLRLFAVVSLPEATFAPFRGVARACVLFGRKEATPLPQTVPIWRSAGVGYDDSGRPYGKSDLTDIAMARRRDDPVARMGVAEDGGVRMPPPSTGHSATQCHVLGDIAEVFTGKNPDRSLYSDEGPWLLKVGDLSGSMVSWRDRERSHVPIWWFEKNRRYHVRPGDVCLTAAAHRPRYIGLKVDLLDEVPDAGAMPSGEVMVIRLRAGAPFAPEQLLFYLRSEAGYGQIQDIVRGSTGHLYPRDMEGILIPPLEGNPEAETVRTLFASAAAAYRQYRRLEMEAAGVGVKAPTFLKE